MDCQNKLEILQFSFEKFLLYHEVNYQKSLYGENLLNIKNGNYTKVKTPFERAWELYTERIYEKKYEFDENDQPVYYTKGQQKGQRKYKVNSHYKIPRTKWTHTNDWMDKFYEWVEIPCGKCPICKCNTANEWATKAWMEMQYHEKSCFLTLTYNNKNLPHIDNNKNKKATLEPKKQVWTPFMKCLRDHYGTGLKFLMCGEYGPKTKRPHYHAIIFGMFPDDAEFAGISKSGHIMYKSKWIEEHWGKGLVTVGVANTQSACYVAQYTAKKLSKEETAGKGRVEEYIHASNRPGLGTPYWIENKETILANSTILYDSFTHKIPRTFLRQEERENPLEFYLWKVRNEQKQRLTELNKPETDLSDFEIKLNNIKKFKESALHRIRNDL